MKRRESVNRIKAKEKNKAQRKQETVYFNREQFILIGKRPIFRFTLYFNSYTLFLVEWKWNEGREVSEEKNERNARSLHFISLTIPFHYI